MRSLFLVLLFLAGCQCQPPVATSPDSGGGSAGGSQTGSGGGGEPVMCPAGTSLDGGVCVIEVGCAGLPCVHGTCADTPAGAVCTCATGWGGTTCAACDAANGYHSDGNGGCTTDVCVPNPCMSAERVCQANGAMAACVCRPGTHDEGGACVPDTTCLPNSCNGHGTCSDTGGTVVCTCSAGFAGPSCAQCDLAGGYHPDGAGGCTTDVCRPNPCVAPNRGVCAAVNGMAACSCNAGFHDENGVCRVDEVCTPSSCSGHGTCSVQQGRVQCACAAGYGGPSCNQCDAAAGWHPDGAGSCTNDPCLPNPCTMNGRTACVASGTGFTCQCPAGQHDDGMGGCTADPCIPNVCLAMNQACQAVNGMPSCYTPSCDDMNPCTTDAVSGGSCTHAPLANGTACQTSLCTTGQTCQAGQCTGGSPRVCDDLNPCTDDACSPSQGCVAVNDDTNVPADAYACTVDTCSGGVAAHAPSDARCDDGLWCTGVEQCSPGQPGANASGCRTTSVPAPPATTACQGWGACIEATRTFTSMPAAMGTACNDGLACTLGDACDGAGACRGMVTPACTANDCTSTHSGSGDVDVPVSNVSGTLTLAGGPPPAMHNDYTGADIYLVAKDTGAAHYLGGYSYQWQSSGVYVLRTGTYGGKVPAGVYDVLYRRAYDSQYKTVSRTLPTDAHVNGYQVLQKDVTLAPGNVTLNVDIPVVNVSGTLTLGGAPPPAMHTDYGGADIYLVSKETGAAHYLGGYSYQWQSSGVYVLRTGTYGGKVPAGTYDVLYRRAYDSTYKTVSRTLPTDAHVNGYQVLQRDVVLAAGNATLNVDIPVANVSGALTLAGAPPPAMHTDYSGADIYLVSKETGAAHYLGGYSYQWQSSGVYVLRTGTYGGKVPAGVYDVLYRRAYDSQYKTVSRTLPTDAHVNGYQVLQRDVTLAAGNVTLNVDIPVANVSGALTLGGAPPPAMHTDYSGADIYLVSKETGAAHYLGGYSYQWQSSGVYVLRTGTYGGKVPAGVYDVLYRRAYDSQYKTVSRTLPADAHVNGYVLLQKNVVLGAGNVTLNVDIPVANVSGTLTLGGAAPPAMHTDYNGADIYLVSKDTGAAHYFGGYSYQWQSSGVYVLRTGTYGGKVPAGVYDVLYRRAYDSQYQTVSRTLPTDAHVNGYQVLQRDVVLPAGSSTLDVNIPVASINGTLTLAGMPPPAMHTDYNGGDIYLVSKDTDAAHYVGGYSYQWQSSGVYVLRSGTYGGKLPSGVYDVLYRRAYDSQYKTVSRTLPTDAHVNGYKVLDRCALYP